MNSYISKTVTAERLFLANRLHLPVLLSSTLSSDTRIQNWGVEGEGKIDSEGEEKPKEILTENNKNIGI